MIDFDYAARQLVSVWRMGFTREWEGARDWREGLDRSVDGVFRSFWAIAFAAPFALLGFVGVRKVARQIPEVDVTPLLEAPLGLMLGVEFSAYIVDWAISVAAIVIVARTLELTKSITDTIICYNWVQVFAVAIQVIPIAIMSFLGDQTLAGLIALPTLVIVLVLYWSLFRRALGAKVGMTIALIILLSLISIIVRNGIVAVATAFLQPSS